MIKKKNKEKRTIHRFTISLPDSIHKDLRATTKESGTTMADFVRQSIKLGLIALNAQKSDDCRLIVEKNGVQQELLII